jgi:hypothetical protein
MPSAFVVLKLLSNVATYMEMYVVATVSLSCANHHHVAPSEGLSQLMGASPSFSGGNVVGRLHSCCFSVFVDLWLRLIGI